jgi:hypothetical protein
MAKSLDKNEAGFLAALEKADPDAEAWITHYGPLDLSGMDPVGRTYEGSYQVMKRLRSRKLVDSDEKRVSHDTGVALNAAGKEALSAWRSEQGLDEKEETG